MSDTQKLTPALSTPERDLLWREICKGLADRAAGRVKDLDVDAILAKGKELLQKRSISNVRKFGVDGRKTLFLLLLLFAIPADDCSAQTPPPPVDEHAFERVPPTVVKRLATRFSLERFTDYLNREGFRFFGEYDSRCWLGWRPASDGPTSFQ